MNNIDIFNLIIALYGALLSTSILIWQLLKAQKKLSITLEYVALVEGVQIVVTNSGYRSITLTTLNMKIPHGEGEKIIYENIRPGDLINIEQIEKDPFPVKLEPGDSISIPLSMTISHDLLDNQLNAKLAIFDSEGKKYSKYNKRTFNAKWGGYSNK